MTPGATSDAYEYAAGDNVYNLFSTSMPIAEYKSGTGKPSIFPVFNNSDVASGDIWNDKPTGYFVLKDGEKAVSIPEGMTPTYRNYVETYKEIDEKYRNQSISGEEFSSQVDQIRNLSGTRDCFVNGVIKLYDSNKKIHLWKYDTQNYVSNESFDDATFYEDGYIGVKKKGKWAFMDENGKLVTDYIFDKVSGLYKGKAYVTYNGKVGIIDLKASLKNHK